MQINNTNAKFKYNIPDVRIVKSLDESEWIIAGIAAGPEPDAAGERFSLEAAEMVADQINRSPIALTDWHAKNSVLGEPIGEVYKAWVTPEGELGVEARLDKVHPSAKYVYEKLQAGKQLGLSVGGHVKKYIDHIEKAGQKIRTFTSLVLDEVAVTTKPWYQPSLGTVISKAIDEAEEAKSVEEGDNAVEKTVTPQADASTTPEAQTPADTAAATSTGSNEPVIEKSQVDAIIDALIARVDARIDEKFATLQAASQPVTQTEDTSGTTEKSQASDDKGLTVEKAFAEIIRRISVIEERVPEQSGPGVLVQKSEIDEFKEMVSAMDPSTRLRFAFRAMNEGK